MDTSDNELLARFEMLPDEVAILMANDSTERTISELCKKYTVPFSQVEYVEIAICLILLGENDVHEFDDELKSVLDIEESETEELAKELFIILFEPVVGSLEDLYEAIHFDKSLRVEKLENETSVISQYIQSQKTIHNSQGIENTEAPKPKITLNFTGMPQNTVTPSVPQPEPAKPIPNTDGPVPLIPKTRPNITLAPDSLPKINTAPAPKITVPTSIPTPPPVFAAPTVNNAMAHTTTPTLPHPQETNPEHLLADHEEPAHFLDAKLTRPTSVPKEQQNMRPRDGVDPYRERID